MEQKKTIEQLDINVNERWGAENTIEKVFPKTKKGFQVDLGTLAKNQSVVYGDGETFYYLLTKK